MRGSARTGTGRLLHRGGSLCLQGIFWRALPQHLPLPAPTAEQQGEEESFLPPPALQVMAMLMPEPAELAGGRETPQDLAGQHPDRLGEGRAHGPHPGPPWERSYSAYPTNPACQMG